MPTAKGVNPFSGYQENKQSRRVDYIEAYLKIARKNRQKYDCVTYLAKAVADHIAVIEINNGLSKKECSASTLLRNVRYKLLLEDYQAENLGNGLKGERKGKWTTSPVEQSNALLAKLEKSNLRNEIQRLKAHIRELESSLQQSDCALSEIPSVTSPDLRKELLELECKYISTCQVVSAILNKFQDVLIVDVNHKRIIDAAIRRGDNTVVDERLATPFFDWLEKHATTR